MDAFKMDYRKTATQEQAAAAERNAARRAIEAERVWLLAQEAHEEEVKQLPSYKEVCRLHKAWEQAQKEHEMALMAEDRVNGTNCFRGGKSSEVVA
jgi:hypothetical protein